MALTLSEAQAISQDFVVKGIIEELIKTSPLMARFPFQNVQGNAISINREDASSPPSVSWHAVNGVWTSNEGKFTNVTFALKILGGDVDIDHFVQQTLSDKNDQAAAQLKMKSKQMAWAFEDTMIYGSKTNTDEFDGMQVLVDDTQRIHCGASATGGALTMAKLDEAIDKCVLGPPDFILLNKTINRRFSAYLRSVASYNVERDTYGNYVTVYRGIPLLTTDMITQTETISSDAYAAKTGGACSSIFLANLGYGTGLSGIQNGGIDKKKFDNLETKDAMRYRLKWYVGSALFSTKALTVIDGITDVAVTA